MNFSLKMAPYFDWLADRVIWLSSPSVGRSSLKTLSRSWVPSGLSSQTSQGLGHAR